MSREDIGMVFARDDLAAGLPGTLPVSLVHHGHPRGPELFFVMHSSNDPDPWGLPGQGGLIAGVELGGGMHGGLNRYELNTTLVLEVPDGRTGIDRTPVGLVDIAPTVAALFGLEMHAAGAALPVMSERPSAIVPETHQESRGAFSQELRRHSVDGRVYLDQGGRVGT
jgi:hypothetical protein